MRDVQGRRPLLALIAVAAGVVAVDHLTKWWALRELPGETIDLVVLDLRLVFNRGAAFGLGSRYAPLVALAACGVVLWLVARRHSAPGRLGTVASGLVLGGAVGNLLDRAFRGGDGFLGGAVVDFVDLRWWPVFNVADVAITTGALLLALVAWRAEP